MVPVTLAIFVLIAMGAPIFSSGFSIRPPQSTIIRSRLHATSDEHNLPGLTCVSSEKRSLHDNHWNKPTRRTVLIGASTSIISLFTTTSNPSKSFAEASVTTEEFQKILKDSYRSIQLVEFSGPKSETCKVKLIDGTTFYISDLIESPVDPRSPLKLQAECRGYNVPTKNLGMELALTGTPKKKKVYMNSRMQEASVKEAAKRERMKADEEDRLRALFEMEEEEALQLQQSIEQ